MSPACEKCWSGSYALAAVSGRDQAEVYAELVKASACSPEEQCGEMHLVLEWTDSQPMCRCKHAARSPGAAREGEGE